MRKQILGVASVIALAAFVFVLGGSAQPAQASADPAPGQLTIVGKDGRYGNLCPLEKTKVDATISGFGARVTVVQSFVNPSPTPIEAVYTFPLPNDAAVDRMRMKVGDRVIEGVIKRREEARRIYDAAKSQGQIAALLDQERPNIFTQSVSNILPKARVEVEITYVQLLKFEEGQFEFSFPMVVGPRFLGNAPDPGKIAPPITPKGTRTGTNIELNVTLQAGAPITAMKSVLHEVNIQPQGNAAAKVALKKKDEIPNRDFILRYTTATDSVQSAFLTHMDPNGKGGFFTLILMPPKAPKEADASPKEVILVMDQSGSQGGFPIEKSKELTLKLIKTLRSQDKFNVMGFNNTVRMLWPQSQPNTPKNIASAEEFVKGMQANGGTQLREGVIAALEGQNDPRLLRLVVFNTDGFVGDEAAILDTIQKQRDRARMFTFGIGNSVNRYLIDSMSVEGRGDAEYVTLAEKADGAVDRFIKRTRSPILLNVNAKFDGEGITDQLPAALPDVFSEKPVILFGRYTKPGKGKLTLTGDMRGKPWSKTMELDFPASSNAPAVATLWARNKVDDLSRRNFLGRSGSDDRNSQAAAITDLAMEFGIMTEYTSFVAVEPRVVNIGGKQRTIRVPVEMADGVSYEMGEDRGLLRGNRPAMSGRMGGGGGFGGAAFQPPVGGAKAKLAAPVSVYGATPDSRMAEMKPEERSQFLYESKVAAKLRSAKGTVEVQVWLVELDDTAISKLEKLGLILEGSDKKLIMVFGICKVEILKKLSQEPWVERIEPIE